MKNGTTAKRAAATALAAAAAFALAIPAQADFSSQGANAENFGKAEDVGKAASSGVSGKPPADAPYRNPALPVEERIDDLLRRLKPEEKAALLHACTGMSCGRIPRIGLEEFRTLDGPNGPRGEKTVYFPSAIAYAATWNTNLQYRIGRALGEETRGMYPRSKTTARMLLGPGCNIARTPLGARNFEYLGEDPVLSGRTAAALIRGLQSVKVAPCLKHYVLNDQEYCRTVIDVDAPERAIREIYMRPFSIAVREADPWAVMNSYNMVRGKYASHSWYINSALFDEGWTGALLTDWGGYHGDVAAINGGTTVETSCKQNPKRDRREIELVENGTIRKDRFDDAVRRALRLYFRVGAFDFDTPEDRAEQARIEKEYLGEAHRKVAYEAAAQSAVLLKNAGGFLPLDFSKIKKIAIVGPNADQITSMIDGKHLRWRGGSGAVKADRETTPLKAAVDAFGKDRVLFAPGCRFEDAQLKTAKSVPGMPAMDPVEAAAQADAVLFFGGLDHTLDREVLGWGRIMPADRPDLELKAGTDAAGKKVDQAELIAAVAAANPRTAVIITAGAPVSVERWHEAVKAILVDWYPGDEGVRAVMDILGGKVNPSGKLPYTFGKKLSDWPVHAKGPKCFPGVEEPLPGGKGKRWREYYEDGIWVGYRGFDRSGATPRYPFGFGLSYTTFEIKPLPPAGMAYRVSVRNTGARAGREVVQFYISKPKDAGVEMPEKELIRFASVELAPGEEKEISFTLDVLDLRYWDEKAGGWRVAPGKHTVLAGDSSDALKPVMEIDFVSPDMLPSSRPGDRNKAAAR